MQSLKKLGLGLLCGLVFLVLYLVLLRPLIEPICVSKTVPVLSSLIEGIKPLEFYVGKADRLVVIICIFLLIVFPSVNHLKRLLRDFFQEKDSAYNLALFRIVLFLFVLLRYGKEKILWFSQLPKELMFPPLGMKTILSIIPVNPHLAGPMYDLFAISCICALIGFLPRIFCWMAAILGVYVLGVPQFFGKTDHYHHLIWFMMILGASPCADVLSVSSMVRWIRGSPIPRPERSRKYALPLRLIWSLIGIVYFFPGFWKFVKSQWHWFLSNNIQYQMYAKWFELGGWTPVFRIDQYTWLCQLLGCATIVFEIFFILVILVPRMRWIAVVSGLLFHNLTNAFMGILFLPLQICYVSFIDWERVFLLIKRMVCRQQFLAQDKIKKSAVVEVLTPSLHWIKVVGICLIGITLFFGFTHQIKAWPFACYPTFAGTVELPEIQMLTIAGVVNGQEEYLDLQRVRDWMAPQKYAGLMERILSDKDEVRRRVRLEKLIESIQGLGVDVSPYSSVRFYKVIRSTLPERFSDDPILKVFLHELKL